MRAVPRVLLLITAASYRAGAFIDAARQLGVDATVGSDRRQALEALSGAATLTLDVRDPARGVPQIVAFAATHPLAAIVAADDDGALLAAEAAAALGLTHAAPSGVRAARDKWLTRTALALAGRRAPWCVRVALDEHPGAVGARLRYPCVLKPRTLSASRGVLRADDAVEFAAAFQRVAAIVRHAGAGEDLVVEGYLPGREVALEGLLSRGTLRTLAVFDKPDPLVGPTFEETLYVTPARIDPATRRAVEHEVAAAAAALGLDHGPVHAELRIDATGPWLVEMAPRSIGGLCSRTLRFGAGESLEAVVLRHALGEPVDALECSPEASAVMMLPIPGAGRLARVEGMERARAVAEIEDVRITVPIGGRVRPLPEGDRYLGFLFARGASADSVERALREAHGLLTVVLDPDPEELP